MPAGFFSVTIEGQLSLGGATRTINILATTIPALKAIVADGGGPAGLIKTGAGRVRLSGANTYTRLTTIQSGMIMVAHAQGPLSSSGEPGRLRTVTLDDVQPLTRIVSGASAATAATTTLLGATAVLALVLGASV